MFFFYASTISDGAGGAHRVGPVCGYVHTYRCTVYVRTYVQIGVWSIILSCIEGYSHNLAEVITIMRRCYLRNNQVPRSKVKVTLKGQKSHVRLP